MDTLRAALAGAERADKDLDSTEEGINSLIERRASERERANAEEESWKASTKAHYAELRERNRYLWIHYYRTLAANHAGIAAHFEEKANAL